MGKYLKHIAVVLLLLLLGGYSCELKTIDSCPCVKSIEQKTARIGENITLNGDFANFDIVNNRITIDGNPISVLSEDFLGDQIKVKVPQNVTSEKVPVSIVAIGCGTVIENCKSSFDYKRVTATEINPNIESRGEDIIIKGSNFNTQDLTQNRVMFGNVLGTVVSANETELVVTVPKGAETGAVIVDVDGFEANAGQFTYKYSVIGMEVLGSSCDEAPAKFKFPTGIATDSEGNVYVADREGNQIYEIPSTTGVIGSFAGNKDGDPGSNPGTGPTTLQFSLFEGPNDIAFDKDNNLYITELNKELSDDGQIRKIISKSDIFNFADNLNSPKGITVDINNNIYFSDLSGTIKRIPEGAANVEDFATSFNLPLGLMIGVSGDLIIADTRNHKIRRFETSSQNVVDIAGDGRPDYRDGVASSSSFDEPADVVIGKKGNIFVADTGNNLIRVVTSTNIVYTLHGDGTQNCVGGYFSPLSLSLYEGIDQKILYIVDTGNKVIKKLLIE